MKLQIVLLFFLGLVLKSAAQTVIFSETLGTVSGTTSIAAHEAADGFDNDSYTMNSGGATNPADIRASSPCDIAGSSGVANVWFTTTNAAYGFAIEGIDASSHSSLTLDYNYRKESGSAHATFSVEYWNGTAWVVIANTAANLFTQSAAATAGWYSAKQLSLPAGAQITGLKLRFVKTGSNAIRIDDIVLKGVPASPVNGTISAGEYGDHTDGSNQQTNSAVTYMKSDAINLYIGVSGANVADGFVMYLDKDPQTLVNGGTNANGTTIGINYDTTNFAELPFRADLVVYVKNSSREYRTANGSNGWNAAIAAFGVYGESGSVREFSIPWSAIGGRPAAYNFFTYITSAAGSVYGQTPAENTGGSIGTSARYSRYYTVSTTTTPPFSRNCYVFNSASDQTSFGAINVYDFTMNTNARSISRTANVGGNWTIAGNLTIGNGTIDLGSGAAAGTYGTTSITGNLNLLGGTFDMNQTTGSVSVAGNVSIASGAVLKLSGASGGDLSLAGNWTRVSGGTFTPNGRTVSFNSSVTADQTLIVSGGTSEIFSCLTIAGAGTLKPSAGIIVTSASGLSLSSSHSTSTLNLNGQTLTLSGGGNLNLNGGQRFITSTAAGGVFKITGNELTVNNGTSLVFGATNVTIDLQHGLDCGTGALVSILGKLQINNGGYCFGNSPKYGASSTLQYNSGNNPYNRQFEWTMPTGTIGTTAGYPKNIQISNGTKLNYVNPVNTGEKGIDGSLTIDAGSALYMNYGGVTCAGPLTIVGDLNNAGDLVLGHAAGDDLKITGNMNLTGTYTCDPNKRSVIFKGNTTQTLSASSKPTFHYIALDGGASLVLDVTCDLDITASDGGNVVSFSNSSQSIKLNNSKTLTLGTTGVNNTFSATTGSFNGTISSNITLKGNGSIGTLKFITPFNLGTLTVDRQNLATAFTLGSALTVNNSLVLSKGLLDLGTQNLTLTATASASGNSNSYVISDLDGSSGRLKKIFGASSGLFTFPIGDAAASANGSQYSPASVQFASGSFTSAVMDIAIKDDFHPSIDASSAERITRYWKITTSGTFTSPNYTFSATYTDADVDALATESNFSSGRWNGSDWTQGAPVNSATNTLSVPGLTTLPGTNEFTAGFPLGLGEINVRGNSTNIVSGDTTPSATDDTDFGKLCADKEKTFTIQNVTGSRGPLLVSGVTVTGAHASDFIVTGIITSPALSVAIGGSTTFKVTFNPTADGIRTAVINIANNDSNENPYTFAIQANADEEINVKANGDDEGGSAAGNIASGDMDASQPQDYLNNTRFAETDIGVESTAKIYKIENLGTRDLTISGTPRVVISGTNASDFIVSQAVPLTPVEIGSCSFATFKVKFKPTSPGDRTAVVSISNSDSDESLYTFALQGKGREAEIDIKGNNVTIASGSTITSETDHTKFANTHITAATSTRIYTVYNTGAGVLNVSNPVISGANASDFSVTANPSPTVAASSGSTTFSIAFDPSTIGIKTATVSIGNTDTNENPYTFNIQGKAINYIECASSTVTTIGIQDFEDTPATPTWTYAVTGTAAKSAGTAYGIDGDSGLTPKYIGAKSLQFSDSNADALITNSVAEFASISTLNFTDIELSLRIGAFSVNSANGMESPDFVLVAVSPDGGSSWSQETRVKGATDNMKWSFSATASGTGSYDNNNIIETGKDFGPSGGAPEYRTTDGYSTLTLTGLPSVAQLKVRITLSNSHPNEIWAIDNLILKGKTQAVKTWNGSNWLDAANAVSTAPTSSQKAIIDGDYDSAINGGSICACEAEVTANGNVVIDAGSTLEVQSGLTNSGTITLENNASLIQHDDFATGSGNISMQRHTQPMYRYDYSYWASPVTADSMFTLNNLSPATLSDKYYCWDAANQGWSLILNGSEAMIPGKGYIVRAPQTFALEPTNTQPYEDAIFIGKPNNGIITYPVYGSLDPGAEKWNLLGNPYPCAIDIEKFFDVAIGNRNVLDGTLYFWTHNTPVQDNDYTPSDYASYNFTGPVSTHSSSNGANMSLPNGFIAAGQSFFARGISAGSGEVVFNNSMRGGLNNQFFRNAPLLSPGTQSREANRIWLNITGSQNGFNQILVGYIEGATNEIDWGYDGVSLSGNNVSLYSIAGNRKFTIQGRGLPFAEQDTVKLGYSNFSNAALTISIDHLDGLFNNQAVYLEDLLSNTIHDLKASPYTFNSAEGSFNDRFILRYTNATLGTGSVAANHDLMIFKEKKQLRFLSPSAPILGVAVFDLAGRMIFEQAAVNATSFSIDAAWSHQVLIVKAKMADGVTVSRKIAY